MKKISTLFLQLVLVLLALGILAFLLIAPQFEGVNSGASFFEIYFRDPFLAYVYLGSIPFFVAIYQAVKALRYVGANQAFSQPVVRALQTIRNCAFITAAAIIGAGAYVRMTVKGEDDPAGFLMLCFVGIFVSLAVGVTAALFRRLVQNAVDLKSENAMTV